MQSTTRKAAASVLFCSVAMALAAQAVAADAPGVGNKNVNALTQPIGPRRVSFEEGQRNIR